MAHQVRPHDDCRHSSVEHATVHGAAERLPVAAGHFHSADDGRLVASVGLYSIELHAAAVKSAKCSVLDLKTPNQMGKKSVNNSQTGHVKTFVT